MTEPLDGPAKANPSRRRGSTTNSTGLDYPNAHRVDEGILTRIRSLLLSRNGRRPPRTPYPSDEGQKHSSEDGNAVIRFDFTTAKSIAKLARSDSGRLSLPDNLDTASIDTTLRMEIIDHEEPSEPIPEFKSTRQSSCASNSTANLNSSSDGALQATDLHDALPLKLAGQRRNTNMESIFKTRRKQTMQ
ncbi:hypothetical protein G7Y89_g1884 [Cudoniella acicularis]|uniref:Uncharacterized protein n=1 Tax=Cudoniella acicularis TaxID=354080 RepID=A0A8H4W703_9HELO|nr:hypothetical protein G7Y89_g1884 [Cudoniella acicularis]